MNTLEITIAALEKNIALFHERFSPEVRAIVVGDLVNDTRKAHGTEKLPDRHLAAGYLDAITREAEEQFDRETREEAATLATTIAEARERLKADIAAAERLPAEADRVSPLTSHHAWTQARLLDVMTEREATEWLEKFGDDDGAVLERYRNADERRDNAIMRAIESRPVFGRVREAVAERKAARVPAKKREAATKLEAAAAQFDVDVALMQRRGGAVMGAMINRARVDPNYTKASDE